MLPLYPPPHTVPLLNYHALTFGIELEMVSAIWYDSDDDDDDDGRGCVREMALSALRGFGIQAQILDPSSEEDDEEDVDYSVWGVSHDDTVFYNAQTIRNLYPEISGLDAISDDTSFSAETMDTVHHASVELISPVFELSNPGMWMRDIGMVLHALSSGPLRHAVPQSAGYHVHIGLGNASFPFDIVKKIAATVVLAETAIDLFHSEHRCDDRLMLQSIVTRPIFRGRSRADIFELIVGARTMEEFKAVICGENVALGQEVWLTFSRYYKVNFTNLDEDDAKNTIEFRQHAGTLDLMAIQMWIRLTGLMVYTAANLSVKRLRDVLTTSGVTKSGMLDPRKFITTFARDEQVARYYLAKIGVTLMPMKPSGEKENIGLSA